MCFRIRVTDNNLQVVYRRECSVPTWALWYANRMKARSLTNIF